MSRFYRVALSLCAAGVFFAMAALSAHAQEAEQESEFHSNSFPFNFENNGEGDFIRQRMDWFYQQRAYPLDHIPAGIRVKALEQLDAKLAARAKHGQGNTNTWQELGPQPIDNWGLVSSGRVDAVAVDPTNPNVVYAGPAQGGIWKSTNGGQTWLPLTDQQASLAIGSITIDPENHNTIYVGTGELNNAVDSYYGAGILKSTDGGNTWVNYPGLFTGGSGGGSRIGGLAVSPTNASIVLAAVGYGGENNWGVFRSADGGQTWTNVLFPPSYGQAYNVYFDPTGQIAYASLDYDGVYKSTDGGVTWNAANGSGSNLLPTGSNIIERVALAMDPNNPLTLYAGLTSATYNYLYGLYKTTDGGNNWTQLVNAPNYCGGQCWYDNIISVAPGNSNVVFIGGSTWTSQIFQSLDGGNSWTAIVPAQNSTIHPDTHALTFSADGSVLYIGNDGGMYSAANPSIGLVQTVTQLNSGTTAGTGLATLQYYAGPAIHPTNTSIGFGGTQDNGTQVYSGTLTWNAVGACGDGTRNLIDFTNPNNVYVNCTGLGIQKATDGGNNFDFAQNGIDPNGTDSINWVPPFTMDPNHSQNLYFGSQYVYQTANGAGSWTAISPDLTGGNGNNLVSIAVSPADSNTVYTLSGDQQIHITRNALAGTGATWTQLNNNGLPNRYMTVMAGDPVTATTAYLGVSGFSGFGDNLGHVFMTTNGSSWTDISGDLPNTPVNDIAIDRSTTDLVKPHAIFVATDIGVFYTVNRGQSWEPLGTGLPRVAVLGLALQNKTHTLWAATHGRSMWSINVTASSLAP